MNPEQDLVPILKKLRLSGVLDSLELRVRQAVEDDVPPSEFLYRLLHDEVERRDARALELRLRRARFASTKSLKDFDFDFNGQIPKAQIIDLCTCTFVERRENVCLVGPAGVGKSHLAQAIGQRACRAGFSALYLRANQIFAQLKASRADGSYDRVLHKLTSPQILIIDDLGLRPLRGDEPVDLFELIRARYEQAATVITSNRSIEEWYPLFGDDLLASATMDRLLHHAQVIVMNGDSYRNPPKGRRPKAGK